MAGTPTGIASIRTLLMSDLVDSTRLVEELGDRRAARLNKRHDRLARDLVAEHGGREIDKTDGFLMLFDRPVAAVRYALAYHEALDALAREEDVELASRVGIHLGEVILRENPTADVERGAKPMEVEGLAKPTAARLMSLAGKRQTLLTRFAFDLARRAAVGTKPLSGDLEWLEHGTYELKGVGEPIEVFEVGVVGFAPLTPPVPKEKAQGPEERGTAPAADAIAVGDRLMERYELTAELGRGGMGRVYQAHDPFLSRDVAVKTISRESLKSESIERFRREALVVAQMDHPLIAPIYDIGDQGGSLFIVLPLLKGTTLRALIREGRLRLGETLDMAIQVAEALDYSHDLGVVHRDVKPENVMVSRHRDELRVRLMDFGLALDVDASRLTGSGALLGTATYMSPEQVAGRPVDARSDIYSLGTVLYECLAGAPPFSGNLQAVVYRIAHEHPEPLRSRGVDVDEEIDDIVLSCLAKEPSERPPSCRDLARALRDYEAGLREKERSKSVTLSMERPARHKDRPDVLPLVGRRTQLAELQARLNTAIAGECQLVLLEGDAGTGKTRLLEELDKLATARGIQVLRGRFGDYHNALPYQGFCQLVQDYFRARESRSRGGAADSSADLRDLAGGLVALFPVFSEIEELRAVSSTDEAEAPRIDPSATAGGTDPTAIFELLARTLRRLAGEEPLVLLLENLHGGDVSLDALEYMVHRLGPTPTLFVGTYRPREVDRSHPLHRLQQNLHDDPRLCRVVLGPLSAAEFRQLVEARLGSEELSDDLVDKLYEATAGSPFFGEELINSLLETEAISRAESGSWRLKKAAILTEALPATIQQAVERRIDRLPDEHRRILSTASVLGRNFDFEDLQALLDDGRDLDDVLDSLVDSGMVAEDRRSRGDRMVFASGVLCDVLYRALPRRKRRLLHRRHAERLEKRYAGRLERVYPQLVHHFSEGEDGAKTVTYGLAYARRSLDTWSVEDTARICRTALEFADDEGTPEALRVSGELRWLLARTERITGNLTRAVKEAERGVAAFERAGALDMAAETALFLAETAWQGRESEATDHWVARGTELARESGSTEILRKLLTLGATVANLRGEYKAAQAALREAEKVAPPEPKGSAEKPVPTGGNLVTALPATIASLDPGIIHTDEEKEVAANVFETLLATSEDGALVPWLCERWDTPGDGRIFEMRLRPDVVFSDGSPLRAEDVKRSLERWARQGTDNSVITLSALEGFQDLVEGTGDEIRGIEVRSDLDIAYHLEAPVPIFPALLTNLEAAVAREIGPDPETVQDVPRFLGTGPFRLAEPLQRVAEAEKVVLVRNPRYWRGSPPRVDQVEFQVFPDASGIARRLRSGELDLGRDLLPEDLEEVLRDSRFRSGLVETTKKNVYFVLFNQSGPVARSRDARRALAGIVRPHDQVWRALGRFAQPAVSLIPPGIRGHDPGRRSHALTHDQATALLAKAGFKPPISFRASIHPLLTDRYAELTNALIREWEALGCEISVQSGPLDLFVKSLRENQDIDILICRWNSDYDDPDNFTFGLFHTENGFFRRYFSSAESDLLLEQARQEKDATRRQSLYQKFEDLVGRESVLVPLFHDVNYRIANPRVRGLRLSNTYPYVNYATVGKVEKASSEGEPKPYVHRRRITRSEIRVPIQSRVETLDPSAGVFFDNWEVIPNVFETLTRVEEGARIVPWLAASYEVESGGRVFRFRLRDDVRFHDGRRLGARDVRYSFERVLRTPKSEIHFPLLPIRGAEALRQGKAATLTGLRILSATELVIELERPVSFFPCLLTGSVTAIVPEGSECFDGRWNEGCVGTGPFRVADFDPHRALKLERNPDYWRPGYPKSDRLVFRFGASPEATLKAFRRGRLSLAADLRPGDVEDLRRDPELAAGYREAPCLATNYIAFNIHRGPFSDVGLRREFARCANYETLLRETIGRSTLPANGLIPPGLLGYEPLDLSTRPPLNGAPAAQVPGESALEALLHPVFGRQYAALWERLCRTWSHAGFNVASVVTEPAPAMELFHEGSADLTASRWVADYPDSHGFLGSLLHTDFGLLGRFCGTPEIDELIAAGEREAEASARHRIYREIEDVIERDALLVPLFHEQTYRFCRPNVEGFRFGLTSPQVYYEELYLTR